MSYDSTSFEDNDTFQINKEAIISLKLSYGDIEKIIIALNGETEISDRLSAILEDEEMEQREELL